MPRRHTSLLFMTLALAVSLRIGVAEALPGCSGLGLGAITCPFSALAMTAFGLMLLQIVIMPLGIRGPLLVSIILPISALMVPILGLLAERAPWHCYRALAYGPMYVAWRVWLGLVVRLRRGRVPWIRTRRAEEDNTAT